MLLLFALIPTVVVTLAWTGLAARTLSMLSARSAWERVAKSGEEALRAVQQTPLAPEQRQVLERHEAEPASRHNSPVVSILWPAGPCGWSWWEPCWWW